MQLLPHDEKFYDLFVNHVRLTEEAANLLRRGGSASHIRDLERKADGVLHETLRRLHKTFVTPIDPEDIHAVISGLDEILDSIEATAYRIEAYQAQPTPSQMNEIADRIVAAVKCLRNIFEALEAKGMEKQEYIQAQCVEINRLETETESLARTAVTGLFTAGADPLRVMKLKDIYEHLETTGDRCEALAGIVENVLAKNS